MPIYQVKLIEKQEIAKDTMAFTFEKPENFTFKAGQFADFTFLNQTGDQGDFIRGFSIASAPYEKKIVIATRMRKSVFKQRLKDTPFGTEFKFDAPYGSFTLHSKGEIPAVFLTGGIGVTPVRSILLQAAYDKLPHRIFLFYSNSSPDTAVFLPELTEAEQVNKNYTFIPTMTNASESQGKWKGHFGHIDKKLFTQHINDLATPIYYISGPKAMVADLRKAVVESGVNEDNIRTEEFSGY